MKTGIHTNFPNRASVACTPKPVRFHVATKSHCTFG